MSPHRGFRPRSTKRLLLLLLLPLVVVVTIGNNIWTIIDLVRVTGADYRNNHSPAKNGTLPALLASVYKRYTVPALNEEAAGLIHLDVAPDACSRAGGEIMRAGNVGDGGWDVCFRHTRERQRRGGRRCIVYSIGISDDPSFDLAMAEKGCEVFSFDPTIGRETGDDFGPQVHFFSVGLGPSDNPGRSIMSLRSMLQMLNHSHIDILKFDVEGAEWDVLESWLAEGGILGPETCAPPPFDMMAAEYHFDRGGAARTMPTKLGLLRQLRERGFLPYSRVENWRYSTYEQLSPGVVGYNCIEAGHVFVPAPGRRCLNRP